MRHARSPRPLTLFALLLLAGASVWTSAASLAPPHVYLKDFMQEYLLAKAALGGVNPYLPLPALARQFISPPPVIALDHPTPHPPPVAVLSLPLAVFLLVKRRWRAAAAVGATAAAAYGGAALLIGADHFADYFRQVGGVAALYRHNGGNISLWSVGYRLFEGTRGEVEVLPLFFSPALARIFSFALPAAALVVALVAARRAAKFDTAFALLAGVSLLVNPVAWTHYLVLAALPLAVAARRLSVGKRTRPQVYLAALTALLLLVSRPNADHLLRQFAFRPAASPPVLTVAALPGLLPLIPVAGLLCLLWLVWRFEEASPANTRGERA
jgi:hypothetical protein